jgi:hypothetical protein
MIMRRVGRALSDPEARGPEEHDTPLEERAPKRKTYCAAILEAAGAKACSISRRSFTAVRLSSIATSA